MLRQITRSRSFAVAALCFLLTSIAAPASAASTDGTTIASWNIKRLGHGDDTSYRALGTVVAQSGIDFLAVQEVMTEGGLAQLEAAIEGSTGEDWTSLYSHAIGRGSYKEIYAFLWRESEISFVDGAVVYLDKGDKFAREPYSARFQVDDTGDLFVAATVHILYGDSEADRVPEIRTLATYWQWLGETYGGSDRIMLMGDFNMTPDERAWQPLLAHARPLITRGATTLSSKNGRYANLYDNIWVDGHTTLPITSSGIIDFPSLLGISHKQARKGVSDHAPVYVTLTKDTDGAGLSPAELAPPPHPAAVSGFHPDARPPAQPVLGNANSKIFHRPDCPSYDRISDRNKIIFRSVDEARQAGYRIAKNCP